MFLFVNEKWLLIEKKWQFIVNYFNSLASWIKLIIIIAVVYIFIIGFCEFFKRVLIQIPIKIFSLSFLILIVYLMFKRMV